MADDEIGGLSEFVVLHSKDFSTLEKNLLTTIEVNKNQFNQFNSNCL